MNERYEITKSYIPIEIQTALVGLVAFLLFLTTSRMIGIVDDMIPADTGTLALLMRLIVFVIAILSVVATWIQNTRKHYFIDGRSLIIQNAGLGGRKAQEIITPKHAPKMTLSRSFFGNRFGYGDIRIDVDSYSHKTSYELKNILNPEKVIAELRARL